MASSQPAVNIAQLPNLADFGDNRYNYAYIFFLLFILFSLSLFYLLFGFSFVFMSTPPSALTGAVPAGNSVRLVFYAQLPFELPPTYKGAAVRFHYCITIAAQKVTREQ